MGAFSTPKEKRTRNKRIASLVGWGIGFIVLTMVLKQFTPAAASLVTLLAGLSMVVPMTRFDASVQPVADAKQVRYAEIAFIVSAVLALVLLPAGPTVGHGVAGALVVAAVVGGIHHLGTRHQKWQPTRSRLGMLVDSWGRVPGRGPLAALLVGGVVLGGALNMYIKFGPVVGVMLAVVAGRPYWAAARQDAQTRLDVESTLAGAMSGGAWTPLFQQAQRAPIWSLTLTDDGTPDTIVVPIPEGMAADSQPKVEDNLINRLAGWGTYSVQWHTGGPGGKRRAVIQWWPPLPNIVMYDGRPGTGRKVWLGVGKVNREMLQTRPDAVVGAQEDVSLDLAEMPHALIVGGTGGGKSVVAKTLMIQWIKADNFLLICDPKRVGFNQFKGKRNVLKVATDVYSIRDTIVAARGEMDARYARMEATGLDNIMSLPEAERPKPLLVLIDEMTEAMAVEKVAKDDEEGNERNQAAMEIRAAVSAIVRLGRAAGVHLIALTQRADVGDGIAGSTKNNLEARVLLGAADNTARLMAGFSDSQVVATPGARGRGIFGRVNTAPIETQFAYSPDEDIERFLAELDLAVEAPRYGDEGVSVLDAYVAAQSEAERLDILQAAVTAEDLTDEDAKALGFASVVEVQALLADYDTKKAESEADAEREVADAKVESQLRRKTPKAPETPAVEDTTTGGDTNDADSTNQHSRTEVTPDFKDRRIEPLPAGEAEAQLAALIGLAEAKRQIVAFKARVLVERKRAEFGVGNGTVSPGHFIFAGPPGTGKTTFARILGSLLRDLGLLSSGHIIDVTPKHLKGEFVGRSAPLADAACDAALGGMLFCDEAYGLCKGIDAFADEARNQMMVRAYNDKDKFSVVLAGYSKEMDDLLDSNEGMRSRFPNRIHFPSYSREELVLIAEAMLEDSQWILAEDARCALVDLMAQQDLGARDWGNARTVENLVLKMTAAASDRLAPLMEAGVEPTKAQVVTLTREDILAAGEDLATKEGDTFPEGEFVVRADPFTGGDGGHAFLNSPDAMAGRAHAGRRVSTVVPPVVEDPTGGLYDIPGIDQAPEPAVTDPGDTPGGLDDWLAQFPT